MFTAQEVLTAKQERVGLPVVLFNDNCYSSIKRAQDWECEGRNVAVTLENPDFQLFAESFGIPSARVTASPDLGEEVRVALGREIPTLIEVDLGRFRI